MNPSASPSDSFDSCAWARKVNARWIVHGGLGGSAEDYLRHLEKTDPARFDRSCQNARTLVNLREPSDDPKPWFYAGLFSLATPEEAARFAAQHWMTHAAISATPSPCPAGDSAVPIEILRRIREALAQLPI